VINKFQDFKRKCEKLINTFGYKFEFVTDNNVLDEDHLDYLM